MEKLKKIIYKAITEPLLKDQLYTQICDEVEDAIYMGESLLPCLELLNELYPQSLDLTYLTAMLLCRNELYQEAWQLLLLGDPIFSTESIKIIKNSPKKLEKSSKAVKSHSERNDTVIPNKNNIIQKQLHFCKEKSTTFPLQCKIEYDDASESNCSSASSVNENAKNIDEAVNDVAGVSCMSTTINRDKRKIRDPCYCSLQATVVNALVDRWHIPMLNDKKRNLAFKNALTNVVNEFIIENSSKDLLPRCSKDSHSLNSTRAQILDENSKKRSEPHIRLCTAKLKHDFSAQQHDPREKNSICEYSAGVLQSCSQSKLVRVVDIGSGTGLLSLYAACNPCVEVTGCDASTVMCKMAEEVLCLNLSAARLESNTPTQDRRGPKIGAVSPLEGWGPELPDCEIQKRKASATKVALLQGNEQCPDDEKQLPKCHEGLSSSEPEIGDVNELSSGENRCMMLPVRKSGQFKSESPPEMRGVDSGASSDADPQAHPECSAEAPEKSNFKRKKRTQRQNKPRKSMKPKQSIKILNTHSSALQLNERADVLVSETLDAALLGEQCIPTILDAWRRLLKSPLACQGSQAARGRVVPGRAEVYVAVVESAYICRYSKPLKYQDDVPSLGPVRITSVSGEEPYNTERLEHLPEGYKLLSQWHQVLDIDFNSIEDLEKLAGGKANKIFSVPCSTSGKVDAVVLCFKLYVDERNVIDTRPGNNTCWETAVYPTVCRRSVQLDDILAFRLTASDVIRIIPVTEPKVISIMSSKLNEKFKNNDENNHSTSASYTEMLSEELERVLKSESLSRQGDLIKVDSVVEVEYPGAVSDSQQSHLTYPMSYEDLTKASDGPFVLPSSSLRAYNSLTFTSAFRHAAQVIATKLKSSSDEILVYDETPFPVAALELHRTLSNVTVVVERESIQYFLTSNNVKCITYEKLIDTRISSNCNPASAGGIASASLGVGPCESECELSRRDIKGALQAPQQRLFSAMFMWPLSDLGILDENFNAKVSFCERLVLRDGFMYPSCIDVYGTVIASDELLSCTRVSDHNTCGVRVEAAMHMVKTTHQLDMTLQSLPHVQLTDVTRLFTVGLISGTAYAESTSNSQFQSGIDWTGQNPIEGFPFCETNKTSLVAEDSFSKALRESREEYTKSSSKNLMCDHKSRKPEGVQKKDKVRSAAALHSRGLLALNDRTLFERTMRLPVKKAGEVTGVAHWFRLHGIFDSARRSNFGVNDRDKVDNSATNSRETLPYLQQTMYCNDIDVKLYGAEFPCERYTTPKIEKTLTNCHSAGVLCTRVSESNSHSKESITISTKSPISSRTNNSLAPDGLRTLLRDDNEKTTGGVPSSASVITVGEESPCNQACFMTDSTFEVEPQQTLILDCVYKNGCFWVDVYPET